MLFEPSGHRLDALSLAGKTESREVELQSLNSASVADGGSKLGEVSLVPLLAKDSGALYASRVVGGRISSHLPATPAYSPRTAWLYREKSITAPGAPRS